MAERDGLRPLHVRVPRQQGVGVGASLAAQRHARPIDGGRQLGGRGARVEAQVGRHLVVPAAGGVQATPGLADERRQPALHIHVDVFQRRVERQLAARQLPGHPVEPGHDGLGVGRCDQADGGQHAGVGLGAAHVIGQQAPVEIDAGVQGRGGWIHGDPEASPPAAARGRRARGRRRGDPCASGLRCSISRLR
jgi:hypothetical protein